MGVSFPLSFNLGNGSGDEDHPPIYRQGGDAVLAGVDGHHLAEGFDGLIVLSASPSDDDSALGGDAESGLGEAGNRDDISEILHPTLTLAVVSHGLHAAVGAKGDGMEFPCGDHGEILPQGCIALSIAVIPRGHAGALGGDGHGMADAAGLYMYFL